MIPSARIQATIDALTEVFEAERPADSVLSAYFRARRFIGSKDRTEIAERVYAVLRAHGRLSWWVEQMGLADGARPRVLLFLRLGEGLSAEAAAGRFDNSRYGPPALSEMERTVNAKLDGHHLTPPTMPEGVALECPDWAEAPLRRALNGRFVPELTTLLDEAPFDLRVNEHKAARDSVLHELRELGYDCAPTPHSPIGIRVVGRPPLTQTALFRDGLIEVQDEGSQLVSLLVEAGPGAQVVDFCAGAGGKSLALAARMGGKGRVVACDVVQGRLNRAKERLRRAGIDNIEPRLLDSEWDRWVKRQKRKFDRVLVDAPCTGTGAWRRNPDARWRPMDLDPLTQTQGSILASAARLVKPGGRLVYVTCSLLREENEDRIAGFLEREAAAFQVVPYGAVWRRVLGTEPPDDADMLRLSPARTHTDGFFLAILERQPEPPAEPAPEPYADTDADPDEVTATAPEAPRETGAP